MQKMFTGTIEIVECANCNVTFGITSDFMKRRRDDHKNFYCPNGHTNVYRGESDEEKPRRENQRLVQKKAELEDDIRERDQKLEHEHNRTTAFKGHITRIKNRVAAGVCPCCNRTFKDLARHMETKHKDYKKEKIVA